MRPWRHNRAKPPSILDDHPTYQSFEGANASTPDPWSGFKFGNGTYAPPNGEWAKRIQLANGGDTRQLWNSTTGKYEQAVTDGGAWMVPKSMGKPGAADFNFSPETKEPLGSKLALGAAMAGVGAAGALGLGAGGAAAAGAGAGGALDASALGALDFGSLNAGALSDAVLADAGLSAGAAGAGTGALADAAASSVADFGAIDGGALGDAAIADAGGGVGTTAATTTGTTAAGGQPMDWFDVVNGLDFGDTSAMTGALENGAVDPFEWANSLDLSGLDTAKMAQALESGALTPSATGLSKLTDLVKNLPANAQSAATAAIQKFTTDPAGALKDIAKLGIPVAAIAGLFENSKSPLVPKMAQAATGALDAADRFAAMSPIATTASQQKAIDTANAGTGAWKPYIDTASKALPDVNIDAYMNPYIKGALDPAALEVKRAADAKRISNNAAAGMRGAFGGTRMAVQQGALDRGELEATGDVYRKGYSDAFDKAVSAATSDRDRALSTGKAVGALTDSDFNRLSAAGALERQPLEDQRNQVSDTAKLYTGVIHGTAPAVSATTPTSKLTQAVGALGALSEADKAGILP
jgi:hypothetical protein